MKARSILALKSLPIATTPIVFTSIDVTEVG